jgi:AraC-like DNA-binding protein
VVVAARGDVDVIGVRFHPARAYPFLAAAPAEVVDLVAPAPDVMARELAALPARLEPAPTETLFTVVEDALLERLGRAGSDARFDRLASALIAADGPTMHGLAHAAGISLRQFERLFKSRAGVAAKTLQRVVRFHRIAKRLLDGGSVPDLATLALDGGFFDQAHLSHEFRALAEVSPSRYPDRAGALDRLFADV